MRRYTLLLIGFLLGWFPWVGHSETAVRTDIQRVFVVFKTHLDVGFTDLSSVVTDRYMHDFIPKALDVADRLRADGSTDRYVWTTGSWLIWKYLQTASPADVARLEKAIRQGDIVWNGVPYTVETESMNADLLETQLLLAQQLDQRFGKKTIAAKMTDVPGHTRSIIAPLNRAGIRFLHIGVNPASAIPDVPEFCRWQDPEGHEVILVYQQDYGAESILPDGKQAISIHFTGDNHGPHSYEQVKKIYADLHQRYPNARLEAVSFNEIAEALLPNIASLPVVTSEIGDTWIYGYGSAPIRMAKFRALMRLYSQWLREGKLERASDASLNFAIELGLIAEHTQGMDIKTHLKNWDKYDMDAFMAARSSEAFQRVERSWKELDAYVDQAISCLPEALRTEALQQMQEIDSPQPLHLTAKATSLDQPQSWCYTSQKHPLFQVMGLTYEMSDTTDYNRFLDHYLRARYDWALADLGKPGLEQSHAKHVQVKAEVVKQEVRKEKAGRRTISELAFPQQTGVDTRVYPKQMWVNCLESKDGQWIDLELTILQKPAVRLPEAYWLSFRVENILSIIAEKTGAPVDLLDVVEKGNRQMHGIDRYVDLVTSDGIYRIWSEDAFLVQVGELQALNYSTAKPDMHRGIHFNLSNNWWGTNFSMWNEGSLSYRFHVQKLGKSSGE